MLLAWSFDVTGGQFLECAFGTGGLAFGGRVLALGDLKHNPAGQLAGVGQTNGVRRAEAVPTWATVERIDALEGLASGRLHVDCQTALVVVPDQIGAVGAEPTA